MQTSRKTTILVAALLGTCAWVMPAPTAGQAVPPPRPGAQAARPLVPAAGDCLHTIEGLVFRRVGNLLNGPSEPSGLKGIQVQLLDTDDRRIAQTRTDREGRYAFRKVCRGTFVVCPGTPCPARGAIPSRYEPSETRVTVPPQPQNGIDFRLTEPPPVRQPPM